MIDKLAKLFTEDLNEGQAKGFLPREQLNQTLPGHKAYSRGPQQFGGGFVRPARQPRIQSQHIAWFRDAHDQFLSISRANRDLCAARTKHVHAKRDLTFSKKDCAARIMFAETDPLNSRARAQWRI